MIFILLLLSGVEQDKPICDSVCMIELNHVYSDHGDEPYQFTQYIFWEWSFSRGRYDVVEYRCVRDAISYPVATQTGYVLLFWDTRGDRLRRITSRYYRETKTTFDPERIELQYLPMNERRGLSD